jgi:hypothetical protein
MQLRRNSWRINTHNRFVAVLLQTEFVSLVIDVVIHTLLRTFVRTHRETSNLTVPNRVIAPRTIITTPFLQPALPLMLAPPNMPENPPPSLQPPPPGGYTFDWSVDWG